MKLNHNYVRERWQDEENPGTVYYVLKDNGEVVVFYGGLYKEWSQDKEDRIQEEFYTRMEHYIDTHEELGILDLKKSAKNKKEANRTFHELIKGRKMKKEVLSLNR